MEFGGGGLDDGAPPGPPPSADPGSEWTAQLVQDLQAGGLHAWTGYRSGNEILPVVLDVAGRDVAVTDRVHPDGPEAHIDAHLVLLRAGWEIREAFTSRWGERRADYAVRLLTEFKPYSPTT